MMNDTKTDEQTSETSFGPYGGSIVVEEYEDVKIEITRQPWSPGHGISLEVLSMGVSLTAVLKPDDARSIAERLETAADKVEG